MKRASYRDAVDFIAMSYSPDDDWPKSLRGVGHPANTEAVDNIERYASTVLVAYLFDVHPRRVACDVMRARIIATQGVTA